MAGKNKSEAKDNFCGFFKESLSCLTDAFLHPIQISDVRFLLTYEPLPEVLCDEPRTLSISQLFTVVADRVRGGHKVKTLQYDYSLNGPDETGAWMEIVSYHCIPMKPTFENRTFMSRVFPEFISLQAAYQWSVLFEC